ncbi:hypothetical protein ACWGKW_40950 [Streptomyces sp. NPDC054766]
MRSRAADNGWTRPSRTARSGAEFCSAAAATLRISADRLNIGRPPERDLREIMNAMGIFLDDSEPSFGHWLAERLEGLAPC